MDIRNLERMRVGRSAKDVQEVSVVLNVSPSDLQAIDSLREQITAALAPGARRDGSDEQEDSAALQQEVKRLRAALGRAVKLNEKMWGGVVDLKLGS
jgi:pre-rRNA-processing protein IPI3